ncbi:unnamed protein product [Penicillium salamii]|uniref:non-specific serine/threonine protein kinase n=1 Tax=Penicillium salamii TaxID=1612424 RepID=A0A9W4IUD6_9EURO|nr:unnamed protein product [Penicillium salamii]CAG8272388.1 unnamed protein product [Penicillium salamii]CAG8362751.1 unnamed protein product [Penicillium salamii]CAG8389545.1 unnamed protein product [Penicillium salamii]CAG8407549.1 unnamed protein product [Penicillium salamii]
MSTSHQPVVPLPAHATTVSTSTAQKNARSVYPDMLGSPPVPPPRTSSTHHSRRSPNGEKSSSRQGKSRSDRKENRSRTREDRNGRSRRQPEESSREPQQSRTAPIAAPAQSEADGVPEGDLVREPSAVISSMFASDPIVDQEREQVRQADVENASSSGFATNDGTEEARGPRSRHDYANNGNVVKRKETTFGSYILGQTLGEGEFGKVKLGWKRDGSIQVAIKLIRRDTLGHNPSRLPKIYREIAILRELAHPNIVRLHEMVETDRHIGIIMEYASGGELFDYILNNRYLKDNSARRLFAQLVSGVGYLHKKGIVHRDLKLENLLLDRNRNIIITDFGFANTFDPVDPLDEEIEYNLTNKEYVKRKRLDKTGPNGLRRGDLMQTSCGSPCYAAPELVVSDSLYTGRKVDVWSCGVILYAMLAGYLPFDDDPANPDGDNINLLYKYIVTTPLTFPEYVTPHARDLLRRILVPDPRKRADLFEVARHSWLSEFSNIVSHITSSTTNVVDIANTTVSSGTPKEAPPLVRSASVREPPKTAQSNVPAVGGLSHHAGDVSQDPPTEKSRTPRDAKRRTVQVEYVAPQSQTTRGEPPVEKPPSRSRIPVPSEAQNAVPTQQYAETAHKPTEAPALNLNKPLPGHFPRSTSDNAALTGTQSAAIPQGTRPATGGSMNSFGNTGRLPSRGSYGQPVAPTVTATNTQGSLAQPKSRQFALAQEPIHASTSTVSRPSTQNQQLPPTFNTTPRQEPPKGHKRSNTVSSLSDKLFGRSSSILGGRGTQTNAPRTKQDKRYPPVSMKEPLGRENSRMSVDSRRSMQTPHNRKASESGAENRPRRFSLLPQSFSFRGFGTTRAQTPEEAPPSPGPVDPYGPQRPATGPASPAQGESYGRARATSYSAQEAMGPVSERAGEDDRHQIEPLSYEAQIDQQFADLGTQFDHPNDSSFGIPSAEQVYQNSADQYSHHNQSYGSKPSYYDDYNYDSAPRQSTQVSRPNRGPGVLQKNHRKFADAYEYERDGSHHSGSSGAARKVMDFFRRRAKSRAGDDR